MRTRQTVVGTHRCGPGPTTAGPPTPDSRPARWRPASSRAMRSCARSDIEWQVQAAAAIRLPHLGGCTTSQKQGGEQRGAGALLW